MHIIILDKKMIHTSVLKLKWDKLFLLTFVFLVILLSWIQNFDFTYDFILLLTGNSKGINASTAKMLCGSTDKIIFSFFNFILARIMHGALNSVSV